MSDQTPLAYRLRPIKLDDFVGQDHIVGEGSALRMLIEKDQLQSIILSGPPGTGKTSLARIIAEITAAHFVQLNAVTSGIKDIKAVCEDAVRARDTIQPRTVLFIDEIHRFNKSQQDALLPFVESGVVTLIGATTENPYFEVNQALLSRSQVYLLKPLTDEDLIMILSNALTDPNGYGGKVRLSEDALKKIAQMSNGDARIALNNLELAVLASAKPANQEEGTGFKTITLEDADKILRTRRLRYDKAGEDHYDVISAFIKTMRGSDPDAALVWLYRMIQSGEDPRFMFRRMAIFASEDIGNADPRALQLVISAWQAFEFVGMPEGEYFLAHACVYLAQAPKSNAVTRAMSGAKKAIAEASTLEVPNPLRNAPVKGMKQQGYGVGYEYPHTAEEGIVTANYFPVGMAPQTFYEPTERGFEAEVRERLKKARSIVRGQKIS